MSVFARLFTAQVIALTGTGLLTVALGLLAYDLAGGAAGAVLGTVLAIKMVAYVVVAPVMSTLTGRLHPRTVLVGADAVRAAIAVSLPLVGHTWQVYLLVFVLQAASATFTPAFQAVIPAVLVDERDYTRGLSLSRLAYDLEAMLSPLLAAALLTVLDYSGLFVATAAGFLMSGLLVGYAAVPAGARRAKPAPLRDRVLSGTRIMFARSELRALLAMNLAVAAATALVLVNTVVYVRGLQGGDDADVAVTLAAYGAGSMAVALCTPWLLTVIADRTLMAIGAVGAAAGLAVTAAVLSVTTPGPSVLMALWAALGAATAMVTTPAGRLLARTGPDRTAVFTAQFSLSHAGFLLTYPIAGWVGAGVDHGLAATILAILATGAAAAAVRIMVRGRGQLVDGLHADRADRRAQSGSRGRTGP
ncbi:MAG: MFS transporter [Mycolicibacterium neoaurum]|uniref:MFS transporter n=1 Tax=Mycolicibacterium neoaurum TaxID=1795 RepID=UPI002FFA34B4